ncbi:hypothetical protein SAMN05216327_106381 [Dyadobacter sp. SG02]|uniref:hypothetical protein n=1 Tax=Dyadobacter sp. SG02 TaxID=1855291 RepID=UPI0008BEB2ED|nr:hypothetical protein [Dyadobacter sp. SG02]SEJ15634.1 hypothetical protein SAMN05216327_106381 [Dyadobacter sp. SG02]
MKIPQIKFFTPEENAPLAAKSVVKAKPTGHISESGMLIFPKATLEEIGVEPQTALFKIGTAEGKRKIKSLYLIPTEEQAGSFAFTRIG